MPPKITRTKKKSVKIDPKADVFKIENTSEKENIHSKLRTEKTCREKASEFSFEEDEDKRQPLAESQNPQVAPKGKGFWSMKLKNLEPNKSDIQEKKAGLYDFVVSDESSPFKKKKKKPRQKTAKQKKKQQPMFSCVSNNLATKVLKSRSKAYEEHRRSMIREQIILNREKENLADKNAKFTFSTLMPCIGVTSTPAACKVNLVGASNFMFISPVPKDTDFLNDDVTFHTPVANQEPPKENICTEIKTPKRETRLERVLRSRRVVA